MVGVFSCCLQYVRLAAIHRRYKATTAITTGYVSSTYIQHNHIANATYSGLSLGWYTSYRPDTDSSSACHTTCVTTTEACGCLTGCTGLGAGAERLPAPATIMSSAIVSRAC